MKETIIKALVAIICVVICCSSITAGIGEYAEAQKQVAEYAAQYAQGGSSSGLSGDNGLGGNSGGLFDDSTGDVAGDVAGDATGDATGDAGAAQLSKAEVIKLFNETTAAATKGTYKLERGGKFIKPIDVGSLTSALNSIITGVDKNASLDSVVGGFLGIKAQPIVGEVKGGKGEGFDGKYMIKAMNLTEADVVDFAVSGNTYKIKVKDCITPNASSPIAHATNDYITFQEVNKGISDSVGNAVKVVEGESEAKYSNIVFTATIVDGKLTALEYSYTLDASLKIKLAIPSATGTGQAVITGKYTDIAY